MEKDSKKTKNIAVLYHNGCRDGFSGAWAAWLKFKNKAEYIGIEHGKAIPEGLVGKEVYFIDFCYNEKDMAAILAANKKVAILDHHVSQRDVMDISTEHVYADDRSGAVIAWQYFFPGEPIPKLLKHVQDVDLWKFKLPHTKELMAAIEDYPLDFKLWSKLVADFEDKERIKRYLEAGKVILKYEQRIIERVGYHAERVKFDEYDAYVVNSPVLESDIGNWIATHKKAIGIIWSYKRGMIRVSLRSDGKKDVSKLAQRYGGGGHKAASGFAIDAKVEFPWVKVEKKKKAE